MNLPELVINYGGFNAWLSNTGSRYVIKGTHANILRFSKDEKLQDKIDKTGVFSYAVASELELLVEYDTNNYEDKVFIESVDSFWGVNRNII